MFIRACYFYLGKWWDAPILHLSRWSPLHIAISIWLVQSCLNFCHGSILVPVSTIPPGPGGSRVSYHVIPSHPRIPTFQVPLPNLPYHRKCFTGARV